MMQSQWWIPDIDFRISSAVIFFWLLLLFGRGEKRRGWGGRIAASFFLLCGMSWLMRYGITLLHSSVYLESLGFSVYIMALSLLYSLCYRFCVEAPESDYAFNSIVALTVYRIAWNTLKTITVGIQSSVEWLPWSVNSPFQSLFSYVIYFGVCYACYLIYRRQVRGPSQLNPQLLRRLFFIMVLLQMLLEFAFRMVNDGSRMLFLIYLTTLLFCVMNFVLLMVFPYLDRLRQDNASMQDFISRKQEYYEVSREGILSLQTKCHDLKHQIALIRSAEGQRQFDQYLNRLEDSINEYNTVIDTGNKSLDVVLTEKNIICATNGIKFTYIVDGTLFDFMSELDIYALFGNIMDNAIESMANVQEPEKRFVSLKAARRSEMIVLVVQNYFENELRYEAGQLMTTKTEKRHHGFGLRSIQSIAEKYGGMASVATEEHIFKLTVTMAAGGRGSGTNQS